MPDTLPPSVPRGSARAVRTAGKKLEFARQYCSQCPVPIQLISRHALSLDAKASRIRTHKKQNQESPKWARGFRSYARVSRLRSSQRASGRCRRLSHRAWRPRPRTAAEQTISVCRRRNSALRRQTASNSMIRSITSSLESGVLDPRKQLRRETDSPLEGAGFEPSVPRGKGPRLRVSGLFRSDFSVGGNQPEATLKD
jgi:hypothetical protein